MEDEVKKNLHDFLFNQQTFPEELKTSGKRDEFLELLDKYVNIVYHRQKTLILYAGAIPDAVYFIDSGVVRGYTPGRDGKKEKTVSLWLGKSFMTDAISFAHRLKTKLYIEVLPGTILASITHDQLTSIFEAFPSSHIFLSCLIEQHAEHSNTRLNDTDLTAWEKLVEMRRNYPGLDLHVPKETIASFLKITPQHLSRIIKLNKHNGH